MPIASVPGRPRLGAADQIDLLAVADDHHRLQLPRGAIGSPLLRQFDGASGKIAAMLLQLRFKELEERNASAVVPANPVMIFPS